VTVGGAERPAWSRDSMALALSGAAALADLTHEWAFGGADGSGVRVAVIDSGIDADHPELDGCVDGDGGIELTVDADERVVTTPGPHGDSYGHGTACAGIIHALAPGARITSVKVLGAGLSGRAAAFHAGLAWALDQRFDVVNLSLGTRKLDWALAFHELCDRAYFAGSFLVTAANNVQATSYPSLYASVASVACNLGADPWRYHVNPDPPTEFLARGIGVRVLGLRHGTSVATGNSYAAPHIAGLAALLRSKHPELRPFQVKAALWARAANVVEATGPRVAEPEVAGRLSRVLRATALSRLVDAPRPAGSGTRAR
jgi:subtilisin